MSTKRYPTNATEFVRFINELGEDIYFEDYNEDLWARLWDCEPRAGGGTQWVVMPNAQGHEFDVASDFGGYLDWQGNGLSPAGFTKGEPTEKAFARWKQAQTHQTLVISVPNDLVEAVKVDLLARGITIV